MGGEEAKTVCVMINVQDWSKILKFLLIYEKTY